MRKIIYIIILTLTISSCTNIFSEDFIDLAPEEDLTFEKIFGDYALFKQYSDHNYSYVIGHYSHLFNAMQSGLSDESLNLKVEACTQVINSGSWTATAPPDDGKLYNITRETIAPWDDSYAGLRKVNMIIENIDKVPNFPSGEVKNRCLGEAYFLRAMLYFQLTKRYGGVPLVTKVLTLGEDDVDIPRSSYEDCVEQMVNDCNTAVGLLGLKYDDADNGRATIGAARALKARVLLYAARPLHNPGNDRSKWERARDAAYDVIDMKQYSLYPIYKDLFFQPTCEEIILNRPRPAFDFNAGNTDGGHFYVRFIAPQGYSGWMGTIPSQNFVDMFEDENGYPIDDPATVYDPQKPYVKRDKRFADIILYDDMQWCGRKTQFYHNVDAAGNKTGSVGSDIGTTQRNESAYAIGKLWKDGFKRNDGTKIYLNYIFFRYAEILLNFAEAQNEVDGPESSYKGLSVRKALTDIRERGKHVPVPQSISDTKDKMRARIWNERAIELSFEDHRWYDVLTWHKGVEYFSKPIMGMEVLRYPDNKRKYNIINLSESLGKPRVFKEHMHLYPIPAKEIYKSSALKQNTGW